MVLFVRSAADHGLKRLFACNYEVTDKEKNVEGYDKVWIFRVDRNSDRGCRLLGGKSSGSYQITLFFIWKKCYDLRSCLEGDNDHKKKYQEEENVKKENKMKGKYIFQI